MEWLWRLLSAARQVLESAVWASSRSELASLPLASAPLVLIAALVLPVLLLSQVQASRASRREP